MSEIIIAELGVEGGDATIHGKQIENRWVFWQKGSSIYLDDNDDEAWRYWTGDEVDDLREALPVDWSRFSLISIHMEFLLWFRKAYDEEVKKLPDDQHETHERFTARRWKTILYGQEIF